MLLTLLFLLLVLFTIFVFAVPVCKNSWGERVTLSYKYDSLDYMGVATGLIGSIGLLVCLSIIAIVQIPRQIDYENILYEREMLEYRLENQDKNIVGNELLYREITEFNNDLRCYTRYSDNLWINWFHNQLIAEIDYIDIEGVQEMRGLNG